MFARRSLALIQKQLARNMSGHGVPASHAHRVLAPMNQSYPVPTLLFSEAYQLRQSKNNRLLFLSFAFFLTAVGYVSINNSFELLSPPPKEVNLEL